MAFTDEVTFSLQRFELTLGGGLRVAGAWSGIERRLLGQPTLVLHGEQGSERVKAIDGMLGSLRQWSADFPWKGDPGAIQSAALELGGGLMVELPAPSTSGGQRRFARTPIPLKEVEPAAGGAAGDMISLHTALVQAREEAAAASEALESAQGAVIRAREELRRERSHRKSEATRMGEALDTLRRLAETSLEQERAATQLVSAELSRLEETLTAERAKTAALREEHDSLVAARDAAAGLREELGAAVAARDAAVAARDAATAKLHDAATRQERLQAELDETRQQSAAAAAQAEAEFERIRVVLVDNQRAAEASSAESERQRAQLHEAELGLRASRQETEVLRRQLVEARRLEEQIASLRAELDELRGTAELAEDEAGRLRRRLAAVREVIEEAAAG
jgi:hypothetical protein